MGLASPVFWGNGLAADGRARIESQLGRVAGGDDEVDKLWGRLLPCFPCDVGGFSSSEADPTYGVDAERHISIAIR